VKFKNAILTYLLPAVLVTVILSISFSTIENVNKSSLNQLRLNTTSKLDSTIAALEIWIKKSFFQVKSIASSEYIYNFMDKQKALIDGKIRRASVSEFLLDAIVLGDDGKILYSFDNDLIGNFLYEESIDFWNKCLSTQVPFYQRPFINKLKVGGKHRQMFIVSPIRDETGTFRGAVVLVYSPSKVFKKIFDLAKMGVSGEVYAFDGSGVMLNESRFEDHLRDVKLLNSNESSALKIRLFDPHKNLIEARDKSFKRSQFTLMVEKALSEGDGENFEGYRDYRGVDVVGVWRWHEEYEIGIAAEIDVDEAFSGAKSLSESFVKVFLLLGVFLILYFYYKYEEFKLQRSLEASNKLLEQKNFEMEQFFKAVNKHVLISKTDMRGIITFVNERFEKVSKYTESELVGKNHNVVKSDFHPKEFFKELWDTIKAKHIWHGVIMNKAKDGTSYWVDTTISPVLDDHGKIKEYVAVRTDITNAKEIERALTKSKTEAERLAKIRSNFIANVSHELRTPLNAIIGFLNIIKENVKEKNTLEQIETVCDASENLLEIINDILDFSRIEEGEVKVHDVQTDLELLVTDIFRLYKIKETSSVKLSMELELTKKTILFDKVKLRQIVSNLVGNAFKFTTFGSISIVVKQIMTGEAVCDLEIEISDTGRGIPEEKLFTIFNPFKQVEDSDVVTESGVGLGLAIVDSYTKILGGTIILDSRVGEGTSFKLKFKSIKTLEDLVTKNVEAFDNSLVEGRKALVVDDNMINLKMMRATLEKVGFEVVLEQNPLNCAKHLGEQGFDIIFMDQLMPQINGSEVVLELRAKFSSLPPIISLSASTTVEDLKLFHERFDEVLSKPLKKKDLEYVLKRIFTKS